MCPAALPPSAFAIAPLAREGRGRRSTFKSCILIWNWKTNDVMRKVPITGATGGSPKRKHFIYHYSSNLHKYESINTSFWDKHGWKQFHSSQPWWFISSLFQLFWRQLWQRRVCSPKLLHMHSILHKWSFTKMVKLLLFILKSLFIIAFTLQFDCFTLLIAKILLADHQ